MADGGGASSPVGGIVQMASNIHGGMMDARGARHAAETQANAGYAGLESQRLAMENAIRANAYATQGQRGIGDLAMFRLASMLGIDPREAFPDAFGGGSGTGGAGGAPGSPGGYSGDGVGFGESLLLGDFTGSLQDYQFNPATMSDPASLMGGRVMPGAPGEEFGSLNRQFTLDDFFANRDPAYDFRLQQGMQGIENSAAARGMQLSGANLQELGRYNQNFASNEYQNAFNRDRQFRLDQFDWLTGLMSPGLEASRNLGVGAGNAYANFGRDANESLSNIGNVLGAGQANVSHANSNTVRQFGQDFNNMFSGGMGGGGGQMSLGSMMGGGW